MAALSAIREALAVRLRTIAAPFTVYAQVPDMPTVPAAIVTPGFEGDPLVRFDSTMARGSDEWLITVTVLVQFADDRAAQEEMDAYLAASGPRSVKAVIEADESLGGVASFAHVREARNYGRMTYGEVTYLGVDFGIEITA